MSETPHACMHLVFADPASFTIPDYGVFALCSGLHRQAHRWNDERFRRWGSEGGHDVARLWHSGCSRCKCGTTVRAGCAHEPTKCAPFLDAQRSGRPVPPPGASGVAAINGVGLSGRMRFGLKEHDETDAEANPSKRFDIELLRRAKLLTCSGHSTIGSLR
jgi:hypothetical protein